MDLLESVNGPSESLMRCEIQPVQQLSTPTGPESVSNVIHFSWMEETSAFIAIATKAAMVMCLSLGC
jgi:hypothetical protein